MSTQHSSKAAVGWMGLCLMLAAAGCATPRLTTAPPLPAVSRNPADFSGIPLRVREVTAYDTQGVEDPGIALAFKQALEGGLRRVFTFPDSVRLAEELNPMLIDVVVHVNFSRHRTWLFDALGIWPGLGILNPIIPEWGKMQVQLSATVWDSFGARIFTVEDASYQASYWELFYGWYRNGPEERAIAEAYRQAVAGLYGQLTAAQAEIRVAMAESTKRNLTPSLRASLRGGGAEAQGRADAVRDVAAGYSQSGAAGDGASAEPLKLNKDTQMLVLNFKPLGSVPQHVASSLTKMVMASLQGVSGIRVFGTDDIEAMLGVEKQKDALGCDSTSCMAQMGGVIGAELVVHGDVATIGSQYNVNLTAVDSARAVVRVRISALFRQDEDELVRGVPELVQRVVAQLNAAP